ncbi:uncharacterized protein ColSpa_12093 [Colletotrichum spaethianum]|uniref:Uncharacterized protein n=1 Tax=Colletotrichum spaethianum TaxID=700344 RepID=A0AA37PGV4_9PEZI|nr:uncharacterized protein ColSpa_12093 [Colletotrichum spaethianum]GKT51912.1 hypothetical protein ColSpa_12093 [Colletotrichum spaethianum]
MPLSSIFILFDFVIHNPTHPDTAKNLSLLDVAVGHFSLLEYASGGSFPTSHMTEFAQMARDFVRKASPDGNMNDDGITKHREVNAHSAAATRGSQNQFINQLPINNTENTDIGLTYPTLVSTASHISPPLEHGTPWYGFGTYPILNTYGIHADSMGYLYYPSSENYQSAADMGALMSGIDLQTLLGMQHPAFPDFGTE